MAINREDIIRAAEELERNGISPTMAAVRDHLGGGSFATISPVLRGWKESRKAAQTIVIEMPGELKPPSNVWALSSGKSPPVFPMKSSSRFRLKRKPA